MNKNYLIVLMLIALAFSVFAEGQQEPATPESLEGTELSILTFATEFRDQGMVQDFMDRTGVIVDLQIVPNEDYEAKIRPLLATGQEVPDIFVGEAAYVRQFVEGGYWEPLNEAPYNADTSDMYPYAAAMGTNDDGEVVALTWQTTPGGWFYRRSIAKDVFGTDDPAEIEKLFSSWDKVLETAQILKDNGYVMFPGIGDSIFRIFDANREHAWIEDNKFIIDDQIKEYLRVVKAVRDNGYDAKAADWSGPFFDDMNTTPEDANVFVYGWPTWGLFFVLNGQANSVGDWAVTHGPGSYFWGGTWVGIYKDSPNKAAAWEFIKMLTQDKEWMKEYALRTGDFMSDKEVMAEITPNATNETIGGQNHYEFFAEAADGIDGSHITGFDRQINSILSQVTNEYLDGQLSFDEALETLTERVLEAFPSLSN